MYIQNSTYKQATCDKPFDILKTLCLVFLVTMLCACQHQAKTQQKKMVQKETATHLPQAKPPTTEERTAAMQASNMAKIKQDKYLSAFLFSGFEESPSNTPETNQPATAPSPAIESDPVTIETSHLISVEVWSIILGEEKISLLRKAQKLGATQLPPASEWSQWKLAMGGIDREMLDNKQNIAGEAKKTIYFIAPPDFAKFKNGDYVIVEIANSGGVHLARYLKTN